MWGGDEETQPFHGLGTQGASEAARAVGRAHHGLSGRRAKMVV